MPAILHLVNVHESCASRSSDLAPMQSKAQLNSAAAAQASEARQGPLANGHSPAEAVNAQLATAAPLTSFNPAEVTAAAEAEDGAGGKAATAAAVSAVVAVSDDPPSKKVSYLHHGCNASQHCACSPVQTSAGCRHVLGNTAVKSSGCRL